MPRSENGERLAQFARSQPGGHRRHGRAVGLEDDDVLAAHVAEHRLRRSVRHHLALRQHRQHIAQPLGLVHVVGRQHDAEAFGAQPVDQVPHRHTSLRVQTRRWLVEKQQARPVHQRTRDHQPSAKAAGQRLGLVAGVRREREALEQLVDAPAHLERSGPEVAGRDLEILAHREIAVERVVLRTHAQLPLEAIEITRDVRALEADRAGVGAQKAVEHPERGRLAGAVRAEQPEHLPGVTDQIDAIHDQTPAQTLDERARFEQGWHARHCTDGLTSIGLDADALRSRVTCSCEEWRLPR